MPAKDAALGPVVDRRLEDFEVGRVVAAGPVAVAAEEIVSFARRYDPLPMHVGEDGGRASAHGGLIASGVLTVALKQRLVMSVERNVAIIGVARIADQVFARPVRAGDELSLRQTCTGRRDSRTKRDRGLVFVTYEIFNQRGEAVFSSRETVMVRRRGGGPRDGRPEPCS